MLSYVSGGSSSLSFKHLGGMLKVNLSTVSTDVTKFVATFPGYRVNGSFTADVTDANPAISTTTSSTLTYQQITFTYENNPRLLDDENCILYIPLPVGTYSGGVQIDMYNSAGKVIARYTHDAFSIARKGLTYMGSSVYNLNQVYNVGSSETAVTLPATTEGVTLDFSNAENVADKEITISYYDTDDSNKPKKIYIISPAAIDKSKITLKGNLPKSTVRVISGSYKAIDMTTAATTLIIDPDATVGTVTIEGGNADIAGTVANLIIAAGATADGTNPVKVDVSNTNPPAVTANANASIKAEAGVELTVLAIGGVEITTGGSAGEVHIVRDALADIKYFFANGGEYTMTKDIVLVEPLIAEEGKTITLDLKGKTLSYDGDNLQTGIVIVKRGSTLIINDSSADDENSVGQGKIICGSKAYAAVQVTLAGDNADKTATLIVNNTTLTGDYYAITGNGNRHNTRIVINNSILSGTHESDNFGIYHPQNGSLTISGAATTITGYSAGIEMRGGELSVEDATIQSTAHPSSFTPNGHGTTTVGAGIAIAQHTTKLPITATIHSGTISGFTPLYVVNPQNNPDTDFSKVAVYVEGGTFTATNGGPDDVAKDLNADAATLKILGGNFQDPKALNFGTAASTMIVTLAKDWTLTETIEAAGGTLNLEGYKISSSANYVIRENTVDATLTVNSGDNGTIENTLDDPTETDKGIVLYARQGNIVINGGTFINKTQYEATIHCGGPSATHSTKPVITINGGTFKNNSTAESYKYKAEWKPIVLNVANGLASGQSYDPLVCKSGTFYNQNPANGDDSGSPASFLASGYGARETETNVWTVVAQN